MSMAEIKLPKLADRTPTKLTLSLSPELHRALNDYADFYREAYGSSEPVAELVPGMLETFLESDRAFAKRQRLNGGKA
jgi:hypothetical protein